MAKTDAAYERRITGERHFFSLNIAELLKYKDLILLYARKNVVVTYKQTVLGPLWLWLTPLFSSILQMLVFGYLAGFQTGDVPKIVFYLFSNTSWSMFAGVLASDSQVFLQNYRLFSKVRFPRLAISYANMLSTAITVAFQFVLSFIFLAVYVFLGQVSVKPTAPLVVLPLLFMLLLGQGIGLIFASVTVRYRDMNRLQPFITRVLMFASPVVYPLSQLGGGVLGTVFLLNPLCPALELVRAFLWGAPYPPLWSIALSAVVIIIVNLFGILLFNRRERDYVDSI